MVANSRRAALMGRLAKARASGTGNNFRDGRYRLVVKSMQLVPGFKGERFQCTFVVMNSTKIPVIEIKTQKVLDVTPNPVGSDVDYLQMDLDKEDSAGPGNVRRLVMDLVGQRDISDEDYIDTLASFCDVDADGEALKQPLNPGKGMLIDMETVRKETAKKKVEIITCKWSHIDPATYDQNAMAQWIDQVAAQTLAVQQQQLTQGAEQPQLPQGQLQTQAA